MSISATVKDSGQVGMTTAGSGATVSQAIGAISFSASSLVVVEMYSVPGVAQSASYLVPTASGLTFTARAEAFQVATSKGNMSIFTAPDASGGSRTITLSSGSIQCYGITYVVYQVTGHNTSSPIGATATVANSNTTGPINATLSGTPASTSYLLAGIYVDSNNSTTKAITANANWPADTVDATLNNSTMYGTSQANHRTGTTSTSVDWDDIHPAGAPTAFSVAAGAIEVKVSPGVSAALGIATETNTSQSLGRQRSRALGIGTETNAAQSLARSKRRALGINAETNTAQALGNTAPPFRVFTPPTVEEGIDVRHGLWRFFKFAKGISIGVNGSTVTEIRFPYVNDIDNYDFFYLGGYDHHISNAEAVTLINAGYGDNIT